jgi:pantoate kinase
MRARAFCPGHVTGLFEICRAESVLATGSRGAGLCTTLGATSEVRIEEAAALTVNVIVNGAPSDAEVSVAAVRRLIPEERLLVRIDTRLDLPESQGFGMSAAGALSACAAVGHIMRIDRQRVFEAAHAAEIECGGGMGDVPALYRAGVTIREHPGLPPVGTVHRIDESPEVVLAVVGPPIKTSRMLSNPTLEARINRNGSEKVDELLSRPTVKDLMHLSSSFALETHLAQGRVVEAIKGASSAGMASMAMLGNSVFAVGRTQDLISALRGFGNVWSCGVDVEGTRIVH